MRLVAWWAGCFCLLKRRKGRAGVEDESERRGSIERECFQLGAWEREEKGVASDVRNGTPGSSTVTLPKRN